MDLGKPLQVKAEREKQVSLLAEYLRRKRRREHSAYAAKMVSCEILNLANVLGQLFLMDFFLGGHFATYGSDVFELSERDARARSDAMSVLFPKGHFINDVNQPKSRHTVREDARVMILYCTPQHLRSRAEYFADFIYV